METYTNPLGDPLSIADPFVLKDNGTYYLYGTTSSSEGFRCWTSEDLVNWTSQGLVYRRQEGDWGEKSFWAPEVVKLGEKYYLVFSANGETVKGRGLRLCLAVADSPLGPFEELKAPWFDYNYSAIDAHLFIDDGTPYLFYEMVGVAGEPWTDQGYFWGQIFGVRLTDDLLEMAEQPTLCLFPTEPWEGIESRKARSVEGMTVFMRDGRYYMMYSANHYTDPNYGVGYAVADRPLGPWKKADRNPILKNRLADGISGPGHNSIVASPSGEELFVVYHTHADAENPSHRRVLNLDRLIVRPDGELSVLGPTRTPQPRPR